MDAPNPSGKKKLRQQQRSDVTPVIRCFIRQDLRREKRQLRETRDRKKRRNKHGHSRRDPLIPRSGQRAPRPLASSQSSLPYPQPPRLHPEQLINSRLIKRDSFSSASPDIDLHTHVRWETFFRGRISRQRHSDRVSFKGRISFARMRLKKRILHSKK